MFNLLPKIIFALFFWTLFVFVVLQVPYPETLTQANILQILGFFIPLFLAISFSLNLFFKNIFISFSISLGLILLLILKALNSLNLVTGSLILISTLLFISYFKKNKGKGLTKEGKIPKLTRLKKKYE